MRLFDIALAATALMAAPAASAQFHAVPAAEPAAAKFALRGGVWTCGASGCSASKAEGRPDVVCAALARKLGVLSSFTIGGVALAPDALEKCNARAG